MRSPKILTTALIATALVLLPLPAAAVNGTWSTPETISTVGLEDNPHVVVDSTGRATAVWRSGNYGECVIQSSSRLPGGTWSSPIVIRADGPNVDDINPEVTVDFAGVVTAVWENNGSTTEIWTSSLQPGGTSWLAPTELSDPNSLNSGDPAVTVDPTGVVTAVWTGFDGTANLVQSRSRQPGGTWSSAATVSSAGVDTRAPAVIADSTGALTAVWIAEDEIVMSSSRAPGGTWPSAVPVSDASLAGDVDGVEPPKLAVDSTGVVTAVWSIDYDDGNGMVTQSRFLPRGGTWSSPETLSTLGRNSLSAEVVVDSAGTVTAVWSGHDGTSYLIQSRSRPPGGTWSTPVTLSTLGQRSSFAQMTVDSTGLVIAVWQNSDSLQIQSSVHPRGGVWSSSENVSDSQNLGIASRPQVVVDSTGLATAVWVQGGFVESSTLLNPITPAPAPAPELAATGTNVEWIGLASLLAIVAGSSLWVLARRKHSN